jgi:tRNA(Ile2) C34 agmatinyltransferase TiaS
VEVKYVDVATYFQCPDCGYKQRSKAKKRIKCHKCGRSYRKRKKYEASKKPDEEKGTGFFKYTKED